MKTKKLLIYAAILTLPFILNSCVNEEIFPEKSNITTRAAEQNKLWITMDMNPDDEDRGDYYILVDGVRYGFETTEIHEGQTLELYHKLHYELDYMKGWSIGYKKVYTSQNPVVFVCDEEFMNEVTNGIGWGYHAVIDVILSRSYIHNPIDITLSIAPNGHLNIHANAYTNVTSDVKKKFSLRLKGLYTDIEEFSVTIPKGSLSGNTTVARDFNSYSEIEVVNFTSGSETYDEYSRYVFTSISF